jgi:uncharacterized Tic20 family protein
MAERVPATDDPTIGKLVGDVSKDVSSLIRSEIALAKTELKFSAKAGGVGIALFAAAGFLLVLAVIMLSVAFAYFINFTGLDLAWCFLIVFGVYALIAAVLGLIGYRNLRKVRGPEASIEQLKETKAVLTRE